jgi:hypothetical protein
VSHPKIVVPAAGLVTASVWVRLIVGLFSDILVVTLLSCNGSLVFREYAWEEKSASRLFTAN